ncbi:MAG TPA: hypothetical protein VGH33_26615 [Isosphaeraceae bacterium]
MARPRRPLWKRPYTSFRHGERIRPDANEEPIRLTLYLPGRVLDLAEKLSNRAKALTIQLYCERLLTKALESEWSIGHVAEAEEKHGPFEGLRDVTDDPEYLAEWTASIARRDGAGEAAHDDEIPVDSSPAHALPSEPTMPPPDPSAEIVIRHAGLTGEDALAFLPCLRRGDVPPLATVEELGAAMVQLDRSLAGATTLDRRLAHALHRLALESQVLHTDAFPGAFDAWTIDAIRAVQAAVERILSGEAGA